MTESLAYEINDTTATAEVIDMQTYRDEQQLETGSIDHHTADSAYHQGSEVIFVRDLRKIVAARQDPTRFEALIKEHRPMIRHIAFNHFLLGGENDDLIQEGMFGFYEGVRDYDGIGSPFIAFAKLCVNRQVWTAVRDAAREKHMPLNKSVSLESPYDDEGTLHESIASSGTLPEDVLAGKEELQNLIHFIMEELSLLERNSLRLQLDGNDYESIALELQCDAKSVDNALTRVRHRLRKRFAES